MYDFEMTKERKKELLENIYFTKKEREVFLLLTSGIMKKDLAKYCNYSLRTTQYKIKSIYKKIIAYDEKDNNIYDNYVYIHIFPNGKKYVGCCRNCNVRWNKNGKGYKDNKIMYNDILKYGWENIEHVILLKTKNGGMAYELENNLIKALKLTDKENGYNRQ